MSLTCRATCPMPLTITAPPLAATRRDQGEAARVRPGALGRWPGTCRRASASLPGCWSWSCLGIRGRGGRRRDASAIADHVSDERIAVFGHAVAAPCDVPIGAHE